MELKNKLELYFFDPYLDEDRYTERFYEYTNQAAYKAYSPLYLLRRQVLLLSGKLIRFPQPPINQLPYFSAILLVHIGLDGLIELTNCYDDSTGPDWPGFYLTYFGKNEAQRLGLRVLRNALEHNNFQLFTRLYKKRNDNTKKHYFEIVKYIKLISPDSNECIKVAFTLGEIVQGLFVNGPILEHEDPETKYALVRYNIDPFRFLSKFEDVVNTIYEEIENDTNLLNRFDKSVTDDNWMKVLGYDATL